MVLMSAAWVQWASSLWEDGHRVDLHECSDALSAMAWKRNGYNPASNRRKQGCFQSAFEKTLSAVFTEETTLTANTGKDSTGRCQAHSPMGTSPAKLVMESTGTSPPSIKAPSPITNFTIATSGGGGRLLYSF